jgi:hypothetical protein
MPGDGGGHSAASGGCRRLLIPAVPHTAAILFFSSSFRSRFGGCDLVYRGDAFSAIFGFVRFDVCFIHENELDTKSA